MESQTHGSAAVTRAAARRGLAAATVALADDPQNVAIGQTLTRSDFTITTTPTGRRGGFRLTCFTRCSISFICCIRHCPNRRKKPVCWPKAIGWGIGTPK